MYFTNYEYFTGIAHLVTSTISCDFRKITRISASSFSFPYSDTSIFSRFDFIFTLLVSNGWRIETWFRPKPCNVVTRIPTETHLLTKAIPWWTRFDRPRFHPTANNENSNGLGDANKVIITKSDRLAGRQEIVPRSSTFNIFSRALRWSL